jgi:hypothetical protein
MVVTVWRPAYLLERNKYTDPIFSWYCGLSVRPTPRGEKWLPWRGGSPVASNIGVWTTAFQADARDHRD